MTSNHLTALETAVLHEMALQYPNSVGAFRAQVASATVVSRENSGAGFYTHLKVDRSIDELKDRVYRGVSASVVGLNNPVVFVLFITDGFCDLLEAATIDESTSSIDLCNVTFKIELSRHES